MKLLNVTLSEDTLVFSDGNSRKASDEERAFFTIRKQLKAAIVKKRNEDGDVCLDEAGNPIVEYQVIRWADYHRHSCYSLLDGCVSIPTMVSRTEFAGGITDHGVMCGVLQFYSQMKKAGKLPILGEEFYCETIGGEKERCHLILLAKNEAGYKNLVKLSSMSYSNFYRKPHISYEMLKAHREGLLCTSACIGGELPQAILQEAQGGPVKAKQIVQWFQDVFADDYYIEIQRHGIQNEDLVNNTLIQLAKEYHVKVVAATDTHYVNKEDAEAHEALLCISTKKTFADANRMKFEGTGYHLFSADEMEQLFADIPEALDNTLEIAEKCQNVYIETGKYYLPEFPVPAPFTSEYEYLLSLAKEGFVERYKPMLTILDSDSEEEKRVKQNRKQQYWERFNYEMETIQKMGFAGYFLIVWDFLNFAHQNNIPTGPGRGSGAGSIVLYCLQITDMDPMKYGLLFERFLNPDRISMPDIDSDISEAKRELVIDYVTNKYGVDHVAHIVTQGTLAAKSAIRDVAKILGATPSEAQAITSLIPNAPKMTIKKAIKESREFKTFTESTPTNKRIVEIAKTLEGTPRNLSTHACGICISKTPMTDYLPELTVTDKNGNSSLSTQYNMVECEDVGVLKMDFLGLRTLDVIASAVDEINGENSGMKIEPNQIPLNDPHVYRFLASGNSDGVFQFESDGMKKLLADMYYDVRDEDTVEKGEEYFERLIAAVALYRPGPMDEIHNFIDAMQSGSTVYDHPNLESILSNTYGVLVYQEQIMFAVRTLAGFSAGQSDKIRKAMGKKKTEIMDEYGEYFLHGSSEHDKLHPDAPYHIKGCIANGISESTARLIWDKMVKFASYAFNKSHATCYAALGARTAWLSCYYPTEYMCGMLNSFLGDAAKLSQYIRVCCDRSIPLMPPDVNHSMSGFHIEKQDGEKAIRFGLSGIKDVGNIAADNIIEERGENGIFVSLENFIERMARKKIDKTTLYALICAGALDCFEGTRSAKIASFDRLCSILTQVKKQNKNQLSFFDMCDADSHYLLLPDVEEFPIKKIAELEFKYMGLFIHHPIMEFKDKFDKWKASGMLRDIEDCLKESGTNTEFTARICGMVQKKEFNQYQTKRGTTGYRLNFSLDDSTGTMPCVAFNKDASALTNQLQEGDVIYALGKVTVNNFGLSFFVSRVCCMN